MSVVFVVVPVVAGAWPLVSAAILAGAATLGYQVVRAVEERNVGTRDEAAVAAGSVRLVMEDSQVMAETLMRGESLTLERGGIRATFKRDGRGQCAAHVTGEGRSNTELEAAGRELMDRVRQQFAYARLMEELETRGFEVVREQVEADQAIRVRVRRWS